jgi:hypothetical protein
VQLAALRAFALSEVTSVLDKAKDHQNPVLRAFAALYLAEIDGRVLPGDPLRWELFEEDDAEHTLKLAFIEKLSSHPSPDATRILLGLAKLPALIGAVTQSLELVGDESAIPFLIGRLKYADNRLSARRALVRLGAPAFEALRQTLDEPTVERRVRIHLPRTISAFADDAAVALLLRIMVSEQEGLVRYKALRGIGQLARETQLVIDVEPIVSELKRNALEYLRLFSARASIARDDAVAARLSVKLVVELLDDKIQQSFDRLARLLQVMHRGDDIRTIFSVLQSPDRRQRGQAIEFLDALIRGVSRSADDAATVLRLVVDDLPAADRARRASELVGVFGSPHDTVERLSHDSDEILRDLALHALNAMDRPRQPESASLLQLLERPA